MRFLTESIKHPIQIGTPLGTAARTARIGCDTLHLESASSVLELGPGLGVFTHEIVQRTPDKSIIITIERNAQFAKLLQKKYPTVHTYCDDALNLHTHLSSHSLTHIDCVVNTLPWSNFSEQLQCDLLATITDALAENGEFLAIALATALFTKAAKNFRSLLSENFSNVERSPIVWTNIPPAVFYTCRK